MEVSKFSIVNNNNSKIPKSKKRQALEASAIIGGSTLLGVGTYGVVDCFTERKSYKKIYKQETDTFHKNVADKLNHDVEELEKSGKIVNDNVRKAMQDFYERVERPDYDEKIKLLKELRSSILKKYLKISGGIGLGVGVGAVIAKFLYDKKPSPQNQSASVLAELSGSSVVQPLAAGSVSVNFKGNISFAGIIDKISENLTEDERKSYQKYIDGDDATFSELQVVRMIAGLRINRDWPKGLNEHNKWLYGINDGLPIREKPKTDKEYQMLLLSQEIVIPDEPPKYYRNYDKWFNTDCWKKFQTWPEYTRKCLNFERLETLINKARLEIYAEEKAAAELAAKKELAAACIKYQINQDFLLDFNSVNKNVKIPNAIMIEGKNKSETKDTLKWIVAKANSNYTFIEDKGESNEIRRDQILTVLEKAQENYEKNGKLTLVWVENFDNLLSDRKSNEDVVADFKDLLDKLSRDYKTTILFDCQNTKNLNPITIQPHRVKKYNIDREVTPEEFQRLQDRLVLSSINKIKNSDGYRYKYIPFDDTNYIDLYLGDFGYTPSVLWVESQKTEAINAVIKNFKVIKTIPQFKDIKLLKFPKPDNMNDLDSSNLRCTGKITKDGKVIYECRL